MEIDTGTTELLCAVRDGVALITLNRPEARNAMSDKLTPALRTQIKERGEGRQLVPPRQRELGPAVAEDQQRRAFRSAGEIARGMAHGLDGVFGDRECHGEEKVPWKSTPAQPNFYAPCATAWR